MQCLYFEPEVIEDFMIRMRQDKMRKSDIALIADIVRMMVALNVSCENPRASIATLEDFLNLDKRGAKEWLELTKSRPLPVAEEGKPYIESYPPS